MDIRSIERDDAPAIEFSWEGNDERDRANGRGWAALSSDGSLTGRIFIPAAMTRRSELSEGDLSMLLTLAARSWTTLQTCRMR